MRSAPVAVFLVLSLVAFAFLILPSYGAMSIIRGTVYWYDQYGNLHAFSWVQVTAVSEDGEVTVTSSTTDGTYIMYVAPGTYNVTASSDPGYIPQTKMVTVSPGGVAAGVDFQLEPSGKPIPEYPVPLAPVLLLTTMLAAAMMILRHRRTRQASPGEDHLACSRVAEH
jgi:hypothetical protein